MADSSEEENENFYFITRRKLCLAQDVVEVPQCQNLLCVANKYGVVFAGVKQGVLGFKTSELHVVNRDTSFTNINDIAPADKLGGKVLAKLPNPPQHLALSANQQVLSVVARDEAGKLTIFFYKLQHFFGGGSVFPFSTGEVSSKGTVQVVDLCWNPSPESMAFAFVVESGSVAVVELQGSQMERIATARRIDATAISWSPKGKQLAVGLKNGGVTQYSLTCEVKKEHPVPAGMFNEAVEVKGLYWVSTFTFLVVYSPTGSGNEGLPPPPSAVILNVPKAGNPSTINFDDIFYGTGLGRQQFYFSFLQPWNIIMASSSTSNEIAVLAKEKDSDTNWAHWLQVDTGRAETPLTADQEDTYPRGMALDLTCMDDIWIGTGDEAKKYPPAPVAVVLNNKGVLCPFTAMNVASPVPPNGQPFVASPQDISQSGEPVVAPQVVDITRTTLPLNHPPPQIGTSAATAQPLAVQLPSSQAPTGRPILLGSSSASQLSSLSLVSPLTNLVGQGVQGAATSSQVPPLGLPSVTHSSGATSSMATQAPRGGLPDGHTAQPSFLGLSSMVPPASSLSRSGSQTGGVFNLPGLSSVSTSVAQLSTDSQPSLTTSTSTSAVILASTPLWKTGSTPSPQSPGSFPPSLVFHSPAPSQRLDSIATGQPPISTSASAAPTSAQTLGSTPLWKLGNTASAKPLSSGGPLSQTLSSGGPTSQPLSSGGPTSQPLGSGGPLSQPLSSGGLLSQPLGSGGLLSQPLGSGGPLGQPLSSGGPLSQPLSSGGLLSQPLGSGGPLGQPLGSGGPLSQPLSSGGPRSQTLGSGGPLSQPLSSGGPLSQPLSSGGPTSQTLGSGGPLSQTLGSGGPLGQTLGSGGPLGQPLGSGGPLSQPLGSGGPLSQTLGSGGPLGQTLGSGGPLGQLLSSGGPLGQPLGSGGSLSQPLGSGGPLGQTLGSGGPLGQPLGSGGPLGPPLSSGGPLGQPLGSGGPLSQPLGSGGPLSQTLGSGGPLSQPLSSGGPLSQPLSSGGPTSQQPLGSVPLTKGGAPANIPPSIFSSMSAAPTASVLSSVLSSSSVPPATPQQSPLYTRPVRPTSTMPAPSMSGSALGSIPLASLGKFRSASSPVSTTGVSTGQPAQTSRSPIAALTNMGVISQPPSSSVGQDSTHLLLPSAPIGAGTGGPVGGTREAPSTVPPIIPQSTASMKPSVLPPSRAAPPLGKLPPSATTSTPSMTKMAPTSVLTGAPQAAVQSRQNLDDKYSEEVKKLVETFADSLNGIRERAEGILGRGCFDADEEKNVPAIGTAKERLELTQDLNELHSQIEEMKDNFQLLKYHISDCKSQSLESFTHLEECKSMLNRRRDPRLTEYSTRRPLDPVLKGKRDDLLSRFSKLRVTIRELDSQVEDELNRQAGHQLRQAGSGRTLPLPSTQVLYNTLATHRKITLMQSKKLDQLQKKMEKCGLITPWHLSQKKLLTRSPKSRFRKPSLSPRNRYSLDPSLQFVDTLDSEMGASRGYPFSPGWRVMDERVQEVTDFLMNIQVTPVKRCPVKTLVKQSSSGNLREADRSLEVDEREGSQEDAREKEGTLVTSKEKTAGREPLSHPLSGENHEEDPLSGVTHSEVLGAASGTPVTSDSPTAAEPHAMPRASLSIDPVKLRSQPPPSGAHPPPSGAHLPPSGPHPPPSGPHPLSGPHPPPSGPHPPPSGPHLPPPSGSQPPSPSGPHPPPSGPHPPPSGPHLPPPSGSQPPSPSGPHPPPSGPHPPPSGPYPPQASGPYPPQANGPHPPPSGPHPPPSGPHPPQASGPHPPPSGPHPPLYPSQASGPYPPPSGPYPPLYPSQASGPYPPPSGPYPPLYPSQASGPYPPPSGPYPPPSGPYPPPSGPYPPLYPSQASGPYPPSSGPYPPLYPSQASGLYPPQTSGPHPPPPSRPHPPPPSGPHPPPPSGPHPPPPSGPHSPPPSGPHPPPPSGPHPPPPSGPHLPPPSGPHPPPPSGPHPPPPSGPHLPPPIGPHPPPPSGPHPPSDIPLLTGPYTSGASVIPALAQYSNSGKPVVPAPTVAPVSDQQTSVTTQAFAPWPSTQGNDGGRSQPSMTLGLRLPFDMPQVSMPHGPPSTSVVATQPSSFAQPTGAEEGVKSYSLWRQQEADGLATVTAKDTESQSQGTDIGSVSDLSQEEPAQGESQLSVTSRTAGSPSQARQPPFPSITLTPGTPSKSPASQTAGADKPLLGSSEATRLVSQLTSSSPSVPSSQPSTSTSTVAPLLAARPMFGSHLQPARSGGSSPQFVASSPVHSGDGRESPFELGLHDRRNTPSPAAQSGEGIQFKTSIQGADTFLSGDNGGGNETTKDDDAKDGWVASVPTQPSTSKQFGEKGSNAADNRGQAPTGASEKEPANAAATVPSVTTLLASNKDADPPSTFVASPMPPLRLKGLPTPVQPAATGAEEKASVISLGPTSTSSGSVLPDSVAEGGVGGGDEEAMEETEDAQDGGGDGLFENVPFLSGLGSSAPQTLPTSSATGSSLLGGGLFSGFGMSSAPTDSTGPLVQPSRLGNIGGVSSTATGMFPSSSTPAASAASWWSSVSTHNSSVKLGFGPSLGRMGLGQGMGSTPSLSGQTAQSALSPPRTIPQSAPVVPQTGAFAQYADLNPLAQLSRQSGGPPFGWMQQQQPLSLPLGGGGGGSTATFHGSSFTQYRS